MSFRSSANTEWDFSGRAVVVTGAARGQGASHALAFAQAGADVVLCDIAKEAYTGIAYPMSSPEDLDRSAEACRAFGVRAVSVICDVRNSEQVTVAIDRAIEEFGRIDVLVNNAGIATIYRVEDMTEHIFDEMIDTHLKGTFLCSQQAAKHMRAAKSGRIISIGSTQTFAGFPGLAHYTAAKHGVYGFTKALAIELAPYNINVNMVCPTGVDSPMGNGLMADEKGQAWAEEITELTGPMNLLHGSPLLPAMEISQAVLWLASDAARFMTGHAMSVDGGAGAK